MAKVGKTLGIALLSLAMLNCSSTGPQSLVANDSFELTYPIEEPNVDRKTGSIYDNGARLYPAGRSYAAGAVEVGDILTIILSESAQASRQTGLSTEDNLK